MRSEGDSRSLLTVTAPRLLGHSIIPAQVPMFGQEVALGCRLHGSGEGVTDIKGLIAPLDSRTAARVVVVNHYLHRRPPISWAFGMYVDGQLLGAVTYGTPPSRHLQISACPSDPGRVIELNRLWLDDALPANSESWFVSRTLRMLPPRIVVSYADPLYGHYGYIYRALNFHYAGWTDMERKTPRYDYIPLKGGLTHTREAFRTGYSHRRRRVAKVKYWISTGNRTERRDLNRLCGWPMLDWRTLPPPVYEAAEEDTGA